ncbi:MAG TPA: DUF4375 domain-containing protein [Mucilaginibacter sp.]|jgi:hypothetical protein
MIKPLLDIFSRLWRGKKDNKISKENTSAEEILKSVENFKNRPIYKVLTAEIIDRTPDDQLLQVIFDNLCEKLPKDYSKTYTSILSFSEGQQIIYVIWLLAAEVNNGGFNQYYFNSSGKFRKLVPDALRLINAGKFVDLMTRANLIFETENEKITKHQDGTLEGFSESYKDNPLNALDKKFYELDKNDQLDKLQVQFIRKNKIEFIDN